VPGYCAAGESRAREVDARDRDYLSLNGGSLQTVSGTSLRLKPIRYFPENTTCTLTATTTEGCGSTVFVVP
jgi:hypothetical protein